AGLDHLDAAAASWPRGGRAAVGRFLTWLRATPPGEVAHHYVDTFDLRRDCTLYLTWYRYGDTRARGLALLAFQAAYRQAGVARGGGELPAARPVVLECAALPPRGERLRRGRRAGLGLLRRAVHRAGTPYAALVDAVCARLPAPGVRDRALIRRVSAGGPPQ